MSKPTTAELVVLRDATNARETAPHGPVVLAPATTPLPPASPAQDVGVVASDAPPPSSIDAEDLAAIKAALKETAGNQSRAAKLLGISRKTLLKRLERYDVPRPRKGR